LSWEGARFDHRESMNAMNHILDAESTAYSSKPTSFYLDKMHALEKIQEFYSSQSILLAMDLPFVFIFLTLIWVIAGPLILIPLVLLGIFFAVSSKVGNHLHAALKQRSIMEERRQNFIVETLTGIHTIKSMAMESLMLRRYERLQKHSAESVCELAKINSTVQGIGATISQLAVVCFASIGSIYVIDGVLTIGALAAGTMLSSRVLQPGLNAMNIWTQFQSVRLAHDKVAELYSIAEEKSGSFKSEKGIDGKIELKNVTFKYPTQKENLLEDISLIINAGDSISITGNNGVGKSTLISLLSGFLHPDTGEVKLDGRDIFDYEFEFLRAQIGIVPQRGLLFEGTILENMTLYREGHAIDQAIELSKILGLDEIITRLPSGLDTQVGGAAVDTLSEGVRQKIIMVRSLVGHPKIMLFDDANANFDIKNDVRLYNVIEQFKLEKTLVIVSHRPSFLRLCNRHFKLQDKKLIETTNNSFTQNNNNRAANV
ncbi:MAG: ATP-binding cassette domain-containing protein, partial [Gammaproteobacteria bacterium]|nr:ATP-binding cassette domain-containing protein [Gammaproteobacteria bacterium]